MKILTAQEFAHRIESGKTIAANGFIMAGVADELCAAIEQRFLKTGEPRGLTLVSATSIGDGDARGYNRLAREGLTQRVIAGHWNLMPRVQRLVREEKAQGYNFPQEVISMLMRDIAAHRPGHITPIGLGTFVDPRREGRAHEQHLIRRARVADRADGQKYLFYRAFPIHYALIRGTTADPAGNISMEKRSGHTGGHCDGAGRS